MKELKYINIEGTNKSPQIDFNHLTGELILSGKSIPENAAKVYEPLVNWITDYVAAPRKTTNLRLNFDYFNSATTIWIARMIKVLAMINIPDAVLFIHIYFDLEDFDSMDMEEIKDIISSLLDNIGEVKISLGIKIYAKDETGNIIKENIILI